MHTTFILRPCGIITNHLDFDKMLCRLTIHGAFYGYTPRASYIQAKYRVKFTTVCERVKFSYLRPMSRLFDGITRIGAIASAK